MQQGYRPPPPPDNQQNYQPYSQGNQPGYPQPGYPQNQQPYQQQQYQQQPQRRGLTCSNCGSGNVQISMVQSSASTRNRGRGCLWSIFRGILIMGTAGLWLLVGKSKGKSKTTIKSTKTAVCQNCGNSWAV